MIIGIGGVSTAGKTTLANLIRKMYVGHKISIICQDDFVKPVNEIPRIHDRINWEHPDSIDHEKLMSTILTESKTNDMVIAEGLMIFNNKLISTIFDKKIFISIDYNTFRARKSIDSRWGVEPEWYIEHIWNSYQKYGKPSQYNDYLLLDGNKQTPILTLRNFLKIGITTE